MHLCYFDENKYTEEFLRAVMPAQAGFQVLHGFWIPAFAGMTKVAGMTGGSGNDMEVWQ